MSNTQTVLVTGASGFVGRYLTKELLDAGYRVRVTSRSSSADRQFSEQLIRFQVAPLGSTTDWSAALDRVDCVVHLAARVHIMKSEPQDAGLYSETNAQGTARLARCAVESGVRRFVYISSVKVNGERTIGKPFLPTDIPNPIDDYGKSKLAAELRLFEISARSQMIAAAIRPPLIYGPGVRANFTRLMSMVNRRLPLPLGAIKNARSLVGVWNLCDLIRKVVESHSLSSGVLMVSDGVDLSTPELIRRLAMAMGRSSRLVSVPVSLLKLAGELTGKSAEVARLCGSLTVDIADTKRQLGWTPPVSVDEGLARTVRWYLNEVSARGS